MTWQEHGWKLLVLLPRSRRTLLCLAGGTTWRLGLASTSMWRFGLASSSTRFGLASRSTWWLGLADCSGSPWFGLASSWCPAWIQRETRNNGLFESARRPTRTCRIQQCDKTRLLNEQSTNKNPSTDNTVNSEPAVFKTNNFKSWRYKV